MGLEEDSSTHSQQDFLVALARLTHFYTHVIGEPRKALKLRSALRQFEGRENDLVDAVATKYNKEVPTLSMVNEHKISQSFGEFVRVDIITEQCSHCGFFTELLGVAEPLQRKLPMLSFTPVGPSSQMHDC